MQGPTYAMTYTTVVAYANELAPPGASATMQGIAAGMDDGVGEKIAVQKLYFSFFTVSGYAVGSIIGGFLMGSIGGRGTFQIFSLFAVFCSILHFVLHKTWLHRSEDGGNEQNRAEYKDPEGAIKATENGGK